MIAGTHSVAVRMADAATAWLDGLDAGRRARATFAFDDPERFAWQYTPGPRAGLSVGEMTAVQREAAFAVADAALSPRGAAELRAVIELEPILGALEREVGRRGSERRDPALYWFAVFGDPGAASGWSWRVGGHHVAIQATVAGAEVVGSAPSFLGANPAVVPAGPFVGHRALDGEERLARALLASLAPAQRRLAVVDAVAPPDIFSGTGRRADLREVPRGINGDALEPGQREGLERLIRHYLDRAAGEVADAEWERLMAGGLGAVTFAWAGSDEPGRGHYYAIRGPELLIEYDNTQNGANHIHAVWRDVANDWGEDLLAAHYRAAHGSDER